MSKAITPWLSLCLLVFAVALTLASSPNYRLVMSASAICALAATVGFGMNITGRSRPLKITLGILAVLGGLVTAYSTVAVITMNLR